MNDTIRTALERFQKGLDGDRENRDRDEEDRRFYRGDQWDEADRKLRANRPTITVNRLPQFVKQITGEMRQNKPAIRVLPVDDQTDPELAETYSAVIRHIENQSDAHRVYSKSGEQAVIGGQGWFRILTDYADDKSFDQEVFIRHIRNPLSVVCDPGATDLTRSDMQWAFVSDMLTREDFRRQYPKAKLTEFPSDDSLYANWHDDEKIRIAEYWERTPYERELYLLSDGSTRYADEEVSAEEMDELGLGVVDSRKVTAHKVKCYKITAHEILEEYEWAGQTIPLVRVCGEEVENGDDVYRHGLIHHSKDSQRAYNFSRSAMIEHVASQPKAPYLATSKMIAPHKSSWENLNNGNPPVLLYEPDPEAPGARPQREAPPTMASAWYQEALTSDNDMKATTGIYDASLGQRSNETSGRAIIARDQQGETGSYIYVDNLSAAIRQAGKILLEIIPEIYTGERVVRLMGEDGTIEGFARINTMLPDGTLFNDISVGQFDLEVTTGPAFATKRMEAAEKMMQIVQAVPAIGQVGADMIVKALDMPNGDKLAERLALALLPTGIDPEIDAKRMQLQQQMAQMQGPQQPDPAQMLAMAEQEAKVEGMNIENAKKSREIGKTDADTAYTFARAAHEQAKAATEGAELQEFVAQIVQQTAFELGLASGAR